MSDIAAPHLAGDDVHVWTFSLRVPGDELIALRSTLAPDERARADRLVVPVKRVQSVVSRGTLRRLLSAYTGAAPEELAFEYAFLIDRVAPEHVD